MNVAAPTREVGVEAPANEGGTVTDRVAPSGSKRLLSASRSADEVERATKLETVVGRGKDARMKDSGGTSSLSLSSFGKEEKEDEHQAFVKSSQGEAPEQPTFAAETTLPLEEQEQAVFEHLLCQTTQGLAIRKITVRGAYKLRHARYSIDDGVLTWGTDKKQVANCIHRSSLVAVHKGKTTVRTKRSNAPATHVLSLIGGASDLSDSTTTLDIEAPTRTDRDKFARAFGHFFQIPVLEEDQVQASVGVIENVGEEEDVEDDNDSASLLRSNENTNIANATQSCTSSIASMSKKKLPQWMRLNKRKNSIGSAGGGGSQQQQQQAQHSSKPPMANGKSTQGSLKQQQQRSVGSFGSTDKTSNSTSPPLSNKATVPPPASSNGAKEETYTRPATTTAPRPSRPSSVQQKVGTSSKNSNIDIAPSTSWNSSSSQPPKSITRTASGQNGSSKNESGSIQDDVAASKPKSIDPLSKENTVWTASPQLDLGPLASNKSDNVLDEEGDDCQEDEKSGVSSLTGHGYDQEIVEELHAALAELRSELDASRAEASRAVKVAEHAIQSAEQNTSADWQNTVTHKAAKAAAEAHKAAAEALAQQRLVQEQLDTESSNAAFWKQKAQQAEEQAGVMQTRAAAAEIQRASLYEELSHQRRNHGQSVDAIQKRFSASSSQQQEALSTALEQNRQMEAELAALREELERNKSTNEDKADDESRPSKSGSSRRKLLSRSPKKKTPAKSRPSEPLAKSVSSSGDNGSTASATTSALVDSKSSSTTAAEAMSMERVLKLQADTALVREQFELLHKTTTDQLQALPSESMQWLEQMTTALKSAHTESSSLRERLVVESAARRRLLYEVQDLRGVVRVYCRIRPMNATSDTESTGTGRSSSSQLVCSPSQETLMLHCERSMGGVAAQTDGLGKKAVLSFDFDRIFGPETIQQDVYNEVEEVCLGVLDGYKICILAHGQTGSGKTHALLGDVKKQVGPTSDDGLAKIVVDNHGIQLQAMRQLFSVADHRSDRFKDTFTLTIVEVYNERLCDLLIGTEAGESRGEVVIAETKKSSSSSSRRKSARSVTSEDDEKSKLEIRSNLHGDTVVQGLLSVEVESFDDFCRIWEECLQARQSRLSEQDVDVAEYEASSHVIASLSVTSANISTGHGSVGRIQFVDLAGADLVRRSDQSKQSSPTRSSVSEDLFAAVDNSKDEWKFKNRSLEILSDVVSARSQFVRSVPYRNSTLTHLLRDSLEADTKVLFLACVSADPKDVQETASTLRFASNMRRVHIGKATKHTISAP